MRERVLVISKTEKLKNTGIYKDGVKYGRWIDYFDNGQPWVEVQYIGTTGNVVIINSWDKNGDLILQDGFGTYIDYYDNGEKYSQGTFLYGTPNGEWIYFGEEQEIIKKEFYEDGVLVER